MANTFLQDNNYNRFQKAVVIQATEAGLESPI